MKMVQRIVGELGKQPAVWRHVRNGRRARLHRRHRGEAEPGVVAALRRDGLATAPGRSFFDPQGRRLLAQVEDALADRCKRDDVQAMLHGRAAVDPRKDYRMHLLEAELDVLSPFVQLALHPALLEVANAYMGMLSHVRNVQAWLDVPTPGPPKETQLWHQDTDDVRTVKLFYYLTDVTADSGPFCYVPRTRLGLDPRVRVPCRDPDRIQDEELERAVPRGRWSLCTAPAGTLLFADTTGFHRGLKPRSGHRVMLSIQYASGTCPYGSPLVVRGEPRDLSVAQRYALYLEGERP